MVITALRTVRRSLPRLLVLALLVALAQDCRAAAQAPPADCVAVVLVIDNSGSMEDNDPDGLRFTAARLFLALLDDGDSAGVVVFSTRSRPLGPLVTLRDRAQALHLVEQLQPRAGEGWTDARAAFRDVQAMLSGVDLAGRRAVVLFMTDGKPEIADTPAGYEDEVLAIGRGLGVPILSIALTTAAQTPFLSRLATETGGMVVPARDARDLLDAYLEIFGQVKDRTIMGSGDTAAPGQAALPLEPALAPYVDAVSFVVVKPEGVSANLLAPDGSRFEPPDAGADLPPVEDARFLVVRVERPAGGAWGFGLDGAGTVQARAIVRSRLRIALATPRRFHEVGAPMPIVAGLFEERADGQWVKIIGEASFSAEVLRPDGTRESLDRFYDDGTHGDARAGDGDFTRVYVNADLPGHYSITVRGWKAMVPVERAAQVEAIPFPRLVIDEPSQARYELSTPLPIEVHLEGGTPPELDRGTLVAVITTPSRASHEITLTRDGSRYSNHFQADEEGDHAVEVVARGALYQGLPYERTPWPRTQVRVVPLITIEPAAVELGRLELAAARSGVALPITVTSGCLDVETLSVGLEGRPDLALAEEQFTLPAAQPLRLLVRLRATDGTPVGPVQARLVFRARQGVELAGGVVRVEGDLYEPTITLGPAPLDLGSPARCCGWNGLVLLKAASTSAQTETVHLAVDEVDGLEVRPPALDIPPGESELRVEIAPAWALRPGRYEGRVTLKGRDGVRFVPGPALDLRFLVPQPWVRCAREFGVGGALALAAVVALVKIARWARQAARPPVVTGTLVYWPKGKRSAAVDVDLTGLNRTSISIGRGEDCAICVQDSTLAAEHAVLRAQKGEEGVEVVLEPIGEVRKGYSVVASPTPLLHGQTFTMGQHEFLYLSDTGG